jgi:hypothetical protein
MAKHIKSIPIGTPSRSDIAIKKASLAILPKEPDSPAAAIRKGPTAAETPAIIPVIRKAILKFPSKEI